MTNPATLSARMRRVEAKRGFAGDIAGASDAQLHAFIREGYRELAAKHGSLPQAIGALRRTGDAADAALAQIIEEEIASGNAQRH
ncbi:hypothetical protein [Methylobacterium iners]|uniref:Uncharacterized protein n=1 Tax=Methylobacterium iners TaxID=418707 RepID=A0ABQ4S4D7_9HYPH|nr:hypothetical protein [Methylobacterium iners]GJD97354.1 hypothetical protein OCOJLMKI_4583 [Methylobacterium iners]